MLWPLGRSVGILNSKQLDPRWRWDEEKQTAFDVLKDRLTTSPILAYPGFNLHFKLHTDASQKGIGAVLYQEQSGIERVIAYASRGLSDSERNYPTHKLEFFSSQMGNNREICRLPQR